MIRKSDFRTPRIAKKKRTRRKIYFFVVCSTTMLFIAMLSYISKLEVLGINAVTIEGNAFTPSMDIVEIIHNEISGTYLGIFAKRNVFLYPQNTIAKRLYEKFPRFSNVDVFVNNQAIIVKVEERKPFALWCGIDVNQAENGCYFMDKNAYIFAKAPDFSGNVFFRFYGVLEAIDPIKISYLDTKRFIDLNNFISAIKVTLGLPLTDLRIGASYNELYMESQIIDNYHAGGRVMFNEKGSLDKVYENLHALMAQNNFLKDKKDFLKKIDYIDLRFGNKLYYRFKDLKQINAEKEEVI